MPKSLRRPSGWIAASVLTGLALVLASSTPVPASTSAVLPADAIAPTDRQRATARKVGAHSRGGALPPRADRRQACRRRCTTATWTSSTASAATSSRATSRSSRHYRLQVRRHDPHRRRRARRTRSSRASSSATASASIRDLRCSKTEPDWTVNESFEFDREKAAVARERGRDERAVAQAREERRPVADAHRQDVAGSRGHPAASATSAC